MSTTLEWLEPDGLGGFASGTVDLARTRRYHALLMRAVDTPARRFALVNGIDVFVRTPEGRFALSAQRNQSGVTTPDGSAFVKSFSAEPWPTWVFTLPCGRVVQQEIFVPHGRVATVLIWTVFGSNAGCSLEVRPFLSGRELDSLHHEDDAFRFEPEQIGDVQLWRPYDGVPIIVIKTASVYRHEPRWNRGFLYEDERACGLDNSEDLASPGIFNWDFVFGRATFILASPDQADGLGSELLSYSTSDLVKRLSAAERDRRAVLGEPLTLSSV